MQTNRFLTISFAITFLFFSAGLAATNYQLWYSSPASTWRSQCLPIGNGHIGGMIYGTVATDSITFNENTLWAGGDDSGQTGNYMGFGTLCIGQTIPGGTWSGYRRDLDIGEATSHVTFTAGGYTFTREYLCSFPDSVMVCHYTCSNPGSVSLSVSLKPCITGSSQLSSTSIAAAGTTITFSGYEASNASTDETSGGGANLANLNFEAQAYVKNYGGTLAVQGSAISVQNADSVDIILAAGTNFLQSYAALWRAGSLPHARVTADVQNAAAKSYPSLRAAHVADYQGLFNRFSLNLGDSVNTGTATNVRQTAYVLDTTSSTGHDLGLDVLFVQYGRYLLISSSRNGLPANLQGLWNNSLVPGWRCDYHSDINIEMNYWPSEPMNLDTCAYPFINFVNSLQGPRHVATDVHYPSVRGWTVQTETNHMGGGTWEWNNPGSAWYCNQLWEHFRFTLDTGYLRDTALPIMEGVCQFWQDHLIVTSAAQGLLAAKTLITPDGWSPENTPSSPSADNQIEPGTAYDQQMVWDLFTNFVKGESIVGTDTTYARIVDSLLGRLDPGLHVQSGTLVEWPNLPAETGEAQHRHLSPLVCLYPGSQVSPLIDTGMAGAARSLLTARGDGSTGWSCAWRIACWARLFSGNKAYSQFCHQILSFVYGNLLDNCNDVFQIDGNCGAPAGVAEMLLQSHTGVLYLLPALPSTWPSGSVAGLQARGAFTVAITWSGRKFTGATIHSNRGAICTVRIDTTGVVVSSGGLQVATTPVAGAVHTFQFPTTAGNDYQLGFSVVATMQHADAAGLPPISCRSVGSLMQITFPGMGPNRIAVIDFCGRTVFGKTVNAGTFSWNRTGPGGFPLTAGTYFLRLTSNGRTVVKKMVFE